jgi:hypothetical protein
MMAGLQTESRNQDHLNTTKDATHWTTTETNYTIVSYLNMTQEHACNMRPR